MMLLRSGGKKIQKLKKVGFEYFFGKNVQNQLRNMTGKFEIFF
jgi:hypothetical protein